MRRFHGLVVSLVVVLAGCAAAAPGPRTATPMRSSNEGGEFEYTEGAVPSEPSAISAPADSTSGADVVSSTEGDDSDDDDASAGDDDAALDDGTTEELGADLEIEIEITDDGDDLTDD